MIQKVLRTYAELWELSWSEIMWSSSDSEGTEGKNETIMSKNMPQIAL